jgi:hypothetical protein
MLPEVGGVFGIAIAVAVFAGAGGYASAQAFSDGFAPAIGVAAALSLVGAPAGVAVPGRRRLQTSDGKEWRHGEDHVPGRVAGVQDGA